MARKKVLVLSFSDLMRDPRVNRQIRFLADRYEVTAAGYKDPQIAGVSFRLLCEQPKRLFQKIVSGLQLLSNRFEEQYWLHPRILSSLNSLADLKADLIIANDIDTLPLALKIAKGAKVIFDAHEYVPCEFDDLFLWRLFYKKYKTYLCRTYLSQTDVMLTVAPGIAKEYHQQFGILPTVITNAPDFTSISPSPKPAEKIQMVTHGAALPSRKLEMMIDLFAHLDERFSLDFILVPSSPSYLNKLKKMANRDARIRFLQPVPMHSIVSHINRYDIGLYLLAPSNFNNYHALPNKFFEFIQARLAVVIGPSPEMAHFVNAYQCGLVAKDFSSQSMAKQLMALDADTLQLYKENAHRAAHELCAEKNKLQILQTVEKVLTTA